MSWLLPSFLPQILPSPFPDILCITEQDQKAPNFHLPAHAERNRTGFPESARPAFISALHIVLAGEVGEEAALGHCLQFKWLDLRKN